MNFFDTFTRPSEENLWNSENLSPILHPKNPKKTSNMRALIRTTLRLLPVATFVFAANTVFAQAQTSMTIHELREYKAKIDANADNPEFGHAQAMAHFGALLAEHGLTELPALHVPIPVGDGSSALIVSGQSAATHTGPSPAALMDALRAEIELYRNDPTMAGYVERLRLELSILEGNNN